MVALEQNQAPAQPEADEQERERLHSARAQVERTLEARGWAHRQQMRGLEGQVRGSALGKMGPEGSPGWSRGLVTSWLLVFWNLKRTGGSGRQQPWLARGQCATGTQFLPASSLAPAQAGPLPEWHTWPQQLQPQFPLNNLGPQERGVFLLGAPAEVLDWSLLVTLGHMTLDGHV